MPDRPDVTYRAIVSRCRPETLAGPSGLLAGQVAAEEGDTMVGLDLLGGSLVELENPIAAAVISLGRTAPPQSRAEGHLAGNLTDVLEQPPVRPDRPPVRRRSGQRLGYCVAAGSRPALAAPSRIAASAAGAVTGKSRM